MMRLRGVVLGALAATSAACPTDDNSDGDGGPPQCVEFDAAACTPQFPPEYDRLYDEVLLPICGVQGGACHANADAAGAALGLVIDADRDATHALLLADRDEGAPVVPGDVACSPMSVRVNTDDPMYLMPPGETGLNEGQACALAQWIEAGAPR